jgi:hypothetical protein
MNLNECQREMHSAFLGGFAGQLVSGVIWLVAAILGTWFSPGAGMAALFFSSMGIFPLTQGVARLFDRPGKVDPENGLWALGSQVALTVPLSFLLVGAAVLYRENWFFPTAMIVVGAHYLPFITLYGMKMFGLLSGLLVVLGAGLALYGPDVFSLGGWVSAVLLIVFAFWGRRLVLNEEKQ